jgi:hypothetical protein
MADEPKFALYVSSVEGKLVSRFGAGSRGAPSYIGARRVAGDPTSVVWDTELVVALTVAEVARFSREYERALAAKALKKRTRDEWLAQAARERDAASKGRDNPAPAAPPSAEPEADEKHEVEKPR